MDKVGNYSQTQVSGLGQAELESRALVRTAGALNAIKENVFSRICQKGAQNSSFWRAFHLLLYQYLR